MLSGFPKSRDRITVAFFSSKSGDLTRWVDHFARESRILFNFRWSKLCSSTKIPVNKSVNLQKQIRVFSFANENESMGWISNDSWNLPMVRKFKWEFFQQMKEEFECVNFTRMLVNLGKSELRLCRREQCSNCLEHWGADWSSQTESIVSDEQKVPRLEKLRVKMNKVHFLQNFWVKIPEI